MSSHAPSARQRITHEPHAPGLGHRRPCCALAAPSLHHDHRRPPVAACHRRPYRALHVVPCRSCEPSGSRPITAATPAELLRSLRRGRAVKGRCALIHCWCEHVPRAHQMAAKRSAERRPSALLRHGQAARGQYWSLVRLPLRAAAVAACASSGAGFTSWTAEDAAAPWTDGPLPEVVGRLLWSNEDRSRKSGHVKHCS